jgi:hypothetical protein
VVKRRASRQKWIIIGAVGAVVLAVAALVVAYAAQDEPGEEFADEGNRHLSEAPTAYIWNTRPPTSGPHAPQIAAWGEHSESVAEWMMVHNMEDGGVVMHYNCPDGCPEVVAELRDILDDMGEEQLLLHPYPNMDSKIAVTAWTRMLTLDDVDRNAIVEFIDTYRGIDHHR